MATSSRLRVGVIVDRGMLAVWQYKALLTLAGEADLLVYSCQNTKPAPRRIRNAFYYLLNVFTVRNRLTRLRPWPAELPAAQVHRFNALPEGAWQKLPGELIEQFRTDAVDVLVKFGMGLLRIPSPDQLPIPILSYHHGDPAEFRGRPAGFHEMHAGRPVMGQVVQRLSNDLDAGDIVAFAETKILAHSYRATLIEAYRHSPLLLKRAVENCLAGRSSKPASWGPNYRLPTNRQLFHFLLKQWRAAAKRLHYGLFVEKRWQVATVDLPDSPTFDSLKGALARHQDWQTVATPAGYRFLADPFFHPSEGLLIEGLHRRSSRGQILHIGQHGHRQISGRGGHFSYPAPCANGASWFITPEISDWAPARAFSLGEDGLGGPIDLKIPGRPALLDPTPHHENDLIYLFANRADEGPSVLRLWVAENLEGEFAEHPSSPIRLSPNGSRMAGRLLSVGGNLYRVGQDLRRGYGDGLTFFRVTQIDPSSYSEEAVEDFRFVHVRGPHTLNLARGGAAFDYYVDGFAPFAGIRRLRDRRAARRDD
jgi:hypothetical protein